MIFMRTSSVREDGFTTRRSWRDRVCARLGGFCDLLRAAHHARIPF
jgi:hypothetical protein